jgi:type II secretory pathway pseudopilin PulG
MRPFSRASNASGFTLVELLVSAGVIAVILVSLCDVYFIVGREWNRQHSKEMAMCAASDALGKMSSYIGQAVSVSAQNRFGAGDALVVCLPADTASGTYVPRWDSGVFRYRQGTWLVFYLSNSSGSYSASGNILWAATITDWNNFPASVVPDTSWSLYYGGTNGRIAPIKSLSFSVDASGDRPAVTVNVGSSYQIGKTEVTFTSSRTQCARNVHEI